MRTRALALIAMTLGAALGSGAAGAASPTAHVSAADAGTCSGKFTLEPASNARRQAHDQNANGFVCVKRNPGTGRNAVKDDKL